MREVHEKTLRLLFFYELFILYILTRLEIFNYERNNHYLLYGSQLNNLFMFFLSYGQKSILISEQKHENQEHRYFRNISHNNFYTSPVCKIY